MFHKRAMEEYALTKLYNFLSLQCYKYFDICTNKNLSNTAIIATIFINSFKNLQRNKDSKIKKINIAIL